MLELEQLYHLVAFYEHQTLSSTAEVLHISQPVLTRSMQKLEENLNVQLFVRSKNKITFNETGELAVIYAKKVLNEVDEMKTQLIAFEKRQHTFSIGTVAPAPNLFLSEKVRNMYPDKEIFSEIKEEQILIDGLKDENYSVIIMPYDIEDDKIESVEFMEEQLYFSLPFDHPLASKESLTLGEMDGERMLLMSNIGFWHEMHEKTMPHTKFLVQQDRTVFYDLVELSALPSFTSDYVLTHEGKPKNRKVIPIEDKEAHVTFYCWYLKKNEEKLKPLLYEMIA